MKKIFCSKFCDNKFSKLNIVIKNELKRYFISPLAYIYLTSFLLLNGLFAFYLGGFWERGIANLDSMFAMQAWIYLIFIPGIAMRLWAEEFRNKTIVQIITMPISISTIAWGKFFAAWVFCGIALILTFPFWISINILGEPDNMVILSGYIASFLTAGAILSISTMMSSLTNNQVISLVLSVFVSLLFFLSGLDLVLNIFRIFSPSSIVDMISSFSFLTHFNTMSQGLIELRDIVFFFSIIIMCNFFTILIVSFKTSGTSQSFRSNNKQFYTYSFLFILIGFIGINLTANSLFRNLQIDFTEEKLFTLSDSSKKVIEDLPEETIIKLYYSKELGEKNPEIRLIFDRIRLLLNKYSSISKGKINYKIYNPKFLDDNEDEAISSGLQPFPLIETNQNAFFGMKITDLTNNQSVIPFFSIERQNFIEQDITQKIYELYHKKKTVGILTSLNLFDSFINEGNIQPGWKITDIISELYKVKKINDAKDIENIDILMIAHPLGISDEIVEKIKEYSNNGGKIFLNLDPASEASRIYTNITTHLAPSDIKDLAKFWGFEFYKDYVIADLDNSTAIDATENYQTNPKFSQDIIQIKLTGDSIQKNLIETTNLKEILISSASPLRPISEEIYFIPLLKASENSQLMSMNVVYDNLSPTILLKHFKKDDYEKYISARILSKKPEKPFELIVISDTDYLYDSFWGQTQYVLNKQYTIPIFDNANFVMNSLDILSGDISLIELRGKSAQIRKFNNIERQKKQSQKEYAVKEYDIITEIEKTKLSLEEIIHKRNFENRNVFNADEIAILSKIRKKMTSQKQDLSTIRENIFKETNSIKTIYLFINIYNIPLIILLASLLLWMINNHRKTKEEPFIINKRFLIISSFSLLLLFIGIASTHLTNKTNVDNYENRPAFPELKEKINKVEKISIKTHNKELVFKKEGEDWELEGSKELPVYQERIRSFLSALLQANLHEKKSSKAEHLHIFGLEPIEVKNSPNKKIDLYDKDNHSIESFEVGDYDIDSGRGKKSAYIKFGTKFQTWLANIELIDLSDNWQNWTYSTAWNLRFGRVKKINDQTNIDVLADTLKDLINVYISQETSEKLNKKNLLKHELNITNEENDDIKLIFYTEKAKKTSMKIYMEYVFPNSINNKHLQFFAKKAKNKIFEIDKKDYDKLEDITPYLMKSE